MKRFAVVIAGLAAAVLPAVAVAPVATADVVHPYATSPYFGGQVTISTAPGGNIVLAAVQTTPGAFPYGCWANVRNMEGNWTTGSKGLTQVFPRVYQASFGGLPPGRYEIIQRCGDGTSLLRDRQAYVDIDGGQAVTPEQEKPFDPGNRSEGTCSEEIDRIFDDAQIPGELVDLVVGQFKRSIPVESGFQTLCGVIGNDPAAFCRAAQAYLPVDSAIAVVRGIFDGIDRALGQQNSAGRDWLITQWEGACGHL
ncbi:hypothetical protein ACWEKT_18310 [Nocardia takedensis]